MASPVITIVFTIAESRSPFNWDEANRRHVREAGIEPYEVEEAVLDRRRIGASAYDVESERRSVLLGAERPAKRPVSSEGEIAMARPRKSMTMVKSWREVPTFRSEKEESDFWRTHTPSETLLTEMRELPEELLPPPQPRTRPVAVRFDEYTLRRIKALAAKRGKGYQTLLKEFVFERLYEEERRDGLFSGQGQRTIRRASKP